MPTSLLSHKRAGMHARANGFTIIELLIVMAIMSLMITLIVLNFGGRVDRQQSANLIKTLQQLRKEAVQTSQVRIFRPETAQFTYKAQISDSASLIFYPDGSSTGGDIISADGVRLISISWYNGMVSDAR